MKFLNKYLTTQTPLRAIKTTDTQKKKGNEMAQNIDLIYSVLTQKYTCTPQEANKLIKIIQMLNALKTPCKMKDLERITQWKPITVKLALSKMKPLIATAGTKPQIYQLKAYKND